MAIDYVIDYDCAPKQALTTEGILQRLKSAERARTVIQLFRKNGDDRPPSEMGFEFTRRTPDGQDETRVIVVQDLLDEAAKLDPLEHHCQGCPANRSGMPFGCIGFVQYPITERAENWLLDRLPVPDDTIIWILLRQVVREFDYTGESVETWRAAGDTFFESQQVHGRRLGELSMNANQVFEMLFGRRGYIMPRQAVLLLVFFQAVSRHLEADEIREMEPAPADATDRYPFQMEPDEADDRSMADLKAFFRALYLAWALNVDLLLDA
jgi:hypothetical protein